jgi:hypothetical protein
MFNKSILICSKCNKPFWRDDAAEEDGNISDPDPDLPQAKDVFDIIPPFESDRNFKFAQYYSGLLERGFADTIDREIYLRIELWQTLNNKYRNIRKSSTVDLLKRKIIDFFGKVISGKKEIHKNDETKDLFNSNLKKLITIYKPENDNEQLLLAEMYRELGEFDRALYILNKIRQPESKEFYDKILKAVKRKRSDVFKLN